MKKFVFLTLLLMMKLGSLAASTGTKYAETEDVLYVINDQFISNSITGIDETGIIKSKVLADPTSTFTLKIGQSKTDSIVVKHIPFEINGMTFKKVCFLQTAQPVNMIHLSDIWEQYNMPQTDGPFLYMIDGDIIKGDVNHVMIDKDFIKRVEVIPSSEISSLRHTSASVVRISTVKSMQNRDADIMRIR